jgi:hypothetical protein
MEFQVLWEAEINGEKISGVESEASWFLVDQQGKMYSHMPMKPILPIDSKYTKCIPLFVVGEEALTFDEIEQRVISAKRDAQLIRSTLEAAAERARDWYIRTAGVEGCKSLEEAILEPLKGA